MDLYSRKIVGWAMSERIDTALTLDALQMALSNRTEIRKLKINVPPGIRS